MSMFRSELAYHTLQKAALRVQPRILHLDSSHGSTSVIAHGAQAFFAELKRSRPDLEVEHLNLWDDGVRAGMEYNLDHVRSKMAMLSGNSSDENVNKFAGIEALCAQAASACGLVVSVPMWNYGVPYVLKQYFDCVLHPGLTFKDVSSGPEGLLGGGRELVIITSAGGTAGRDHLTPWLTDVAAMMGFDKPAVVSAKNVAHESREEVIANIARDAEEVARRFQTGSSGVEVSPSKDPASGGTAVEASKDTVADDTNEDPVDEWDYERVLIWLKERGGLSKDCLESLEAMKVTGELWLTASEDDWRSEELGLEDSDVNRLMELQQQHLRELEG